MTATDYIQAAAHLLALSNLGRETLRTEADAADLRAQHAALSAAMHGRLTAVECAVAPDHTFPTPGRLLAWACACRTVAVLGARTTPWHVRYVLASVPRLDTPLPVFETVVREAELELDAAERETPKADALATLTRGFEARRRAALAALLPVLDALDRGAPLLDTAARLRDAADLFEGQSRGEGRAA